MRDLPLHHIGVATRDVEKELRVFEHLGYKACSELFTDPAQKVRGLFISAPGQPTLELLENMGPSGPLDSYLRKGIKWYHFSYEVTDMERELAALLRIEHAKLVVPVTAATFFNKICFVMLPTMMLVELVECRSIA